MLCLSWCKGAVSRPTFLPYCVLLRFAGGLWVPVGAAREEVQRVTYVAFALGQSNAREATVRVSVAAGLSAG